MDNFLPSTDNFFKYLLTIGLALIIFVIVYPAQQQKEIDIEINGYQKDTAILKYKIGRLKKDIAEFALNKSTTQQILDSLKEAESHQTATERIQTELLRGKIRDEFEGRRDRYARLTDSLSIMNITIEAERKKIHKLEGYFSLFKTYKIVFLIAGVFIAIFGLLYWSAAVYRDEKKKDEDLANTHVSAYVKHSGWLKRMMNKKLVLLLVALLFFLAIWFIIWCSSYD